MKNEIENRNIRCEKSKKDVSLLYTYSVITTDQISYVGRKLIDFGCSEYNNCSLVATDRGNRIEYDWSKCPHYPK